MTAKKLKQKAASPEYKVTSREKNAIDKYFVRNAAAPAPRLKVQDNKIELDHPVEVIGQMLLMEAVGTADNDFLNGLLGQLASAGKRGDEDEINFLLSVIKGIEPKDQVEAMLAAQMAAVHVATMTSARHLAHAENLPQQDSAERAFNKLTRTFAAQMEALKRYRTGGEQKVTVQHVSVGEGGQAIVGNVTQARREAGPDKAAAPQLALADLKLRDSQMPPMTIEREPADAAVPLKRKARK